MEAKMVERQQFHKGINKFAIEMYQKMINGITDRNVVISPFSIQRALYMVLNGASGQTANELSKIIGFSGRLTKQSIIQQFSSLVEELTECETLQLFRKIFADSCRLGVSLKSDFVEQTKSDFDTEIEVLNLTEKPDKSAKVKETNDKINKWVSKAINTDSKSPSFDKEIDNPWAFVDVLKFNTLWAIRFDPEQTKKDKFWINDSDSVQVDMMHLRDSCRFGFIIDLDVSILELDCEFDDFSMIFILPDAKTKLAEVETKLVSTNLMYLAAQLRRQDTKVFIPKFTVDVTTILDEPLRKLGGCSCDDLKPADFADCVFEREKGKKESDETNDDAASSCQYPQLPLFAQKVVVALEENGAENDKQKIDTNRVPEEFNLNRPFVFFLKHKCNIVFIGRIVNPTTPTSSC